MTTTLRLITEAELERTFLRVRRSDAKGMRAENIALPWDPREGLWVFDAFGGNEPTKAPLPSDLGTLPNVGLYTLGDEPAFLAQRFDERPVTRWKRLAELGVDSAAICIAPRYVAEQATGDELARGDEEFRKNATRWKVLSIGPALAVGIDVTDDGGYDLYAGLDGKGDVVG